MKYDPETQQMIRDIIKKELKLEVNETSDGCGGRQLSIQLRLGSELLTDKIVTLEYSVDDEY